MIKFIVRVLRVMNVIIYWKENKLIKNFFYIILFVFVSLSKGKKTCKWIILFWNKIKLMKYFKL